MVLVVVTCLYVRQVRRQADQAAEAAQHAQQSARAMQRMAQLVAPGVRARRAEALERLSQMAEDIDHEAKEWQKRGVVEAVQKGQLFGTFVEPERLQEIRSAAGYVGGSVQERAAEAVEALDKLGQELDRADRQRREEGVQDATAKIVADQVTEVRQALSHLSYQVEDELGEIGR